MTGSHSQELAQLVATLASITAKDSVQVMIGSTVQIEDPNGGSPTWGVQIGGMTVTTSWSANVSPYDGAPCVVLLTTSADGKSMYHCAWVMGNYPAVNGIATVTAFTAGSATVQVRIWDSYPGNGVKYTIQRAASYTPTVGDKCIVINVQGSPIAVAPLTVYTNPQPNQPDQPMAPPTQASTGNSWIPAGDSGTWTGAYGSWNSYYGQNVYTGNVYVPASTGSWFYNGGTQGLAGKTSITRIQFWLPPRRAAGDYNSTLNLHFYTHNASWRPGGEPTRVDGPYDQAIIPGWGGGWIDLPLSFAATLKAGGGISIAGDPYIGLTGVGENAGSGALSVDWSM